MRITVEFIGFPDLERRLGDSSVSVEMQGDCLGDLWKHLAAVHGEAFTKVVLTEDGTPDASVQVLKNEKFLISRDDLSHRLQESDRISLVLAMAGG